MMRPSPWTALTAVCLSCTPLKGADNDASPAPGNISPALVSITKTETTLSLPAPQVPPLLPEVEIARAIPVFSPAVYDAVLANDPKRLEQLLKASQSANGVSPEGDTTLSAALRLNRDDLATLLIRHGADVNAPGLGGQRPLALASLRRRAGLLKMLLEGGAEPNQPFAFPVAPEILAPLSRSLQSQLKSQRHITPLMACAARGDVEAVELLLKHGARTQAHSSPGYLYAINFAAEQSHLFIMRLLLGRNPDTEPQLLVTIDLSEQAAWVDREGKQLLRTSISTGRRGYETPEGRYVITNKYKSWTSTIYKVSMPYFMRLNCGAIGLHSGYVTGRPASHGCIRLPSSVARKIFSIANVGDEVVVQE